MYIHIEAEGESQMDLTFSFYLHWYLHTIHPYFDLLFFSIQSFYTTFTFHPSLLNTH